MIEIDGSEGEGGGQIIRSSLALAAVTGKPVRLQNIRAGRSKPGLLRQHLTGVKAIAEIAGGEMIGADLGSRELTFTPGTVRGGEYRYQVGSAGSAVLVAQTVLPALMMSDASSTVTVGGGTHASWAPPFDFFERCFLPLVSQMGANVTASISAHGFYPAGGGEITVGVNPSSGLRGIELVERLGEMRPRVIALVSKVPTSVGDRECDVIRRKADWNVDVCEVIEVAKSGGPGNAVMIECQFDNVTELFVGFGKIGVRAEPIARSTLREARKYLVSDVPVGPYLADQLLMPMGLAASQGRASRFRTTTLTQHSLTHIAILKRFLNIRIDTTSKDDGSVEVIVC
ncbi:RNA 3'-terminal phosphate cyclase [Rubripirellula reticaptiva]|nr:RNA 3'-terminal phosphate cyclase [Rubripirellula reticaptiva]